MSIFLFSQGSFRSFVSFWDFPLLKYPDSSYWLIYSSSIILIIIRLNIRWDLFYKAAMGAMNLCLNLFTDYMHFINN